MTTRAPPWGRRKLIIAALWSEACLLFPALDVMRLGYDVCVPVDAVGGTPVIIKLLQGTQGVGVMIAESAAAVESTIDTLWGLGQNIILQEFIAESKGRDIRALVVGGELVAAMRRTAKKGEFRSNLHRGGMGQRIELSPEYARAALDPARIMGLGLAGVDML